jgi:hypothetical protein
VTVPVPVIVPVPVFVTVFVTMLVTVAVLVLVLVAVPVLMTGRVVMIVRMPVPFAHRGAPALCSLFCHGEAGSTRRIRCTAMAAPKPLSMFTTTTPDAQLVSIAKSAVKPESAVP